MEVEMDINNILCEVITFLERLRDVQLPLTLENLREELLARSKDILSVTTTTIDVRASSPEPYMLMNSGPKSLLLTKRQIDSEEYVRMEESQNPSQTHQDHYETFVNEACQISVNEYSERNDVSRDESQELIGIYKNLSAAQTKSKCHKCGPLYRKEGKKLFLARAEKSRACWIALVGSHLLIYRSERHNRPHTIYPIRGYMARPAPNLIPRDRQKSESAFEMYSPGNETLQFIARTPKDMDQWITKVCEVGYGNESEKIKAEGRKKRRATIESPIDRRKSNLKTTRRRDVAGKSAVTDEPTAKVESVNNKSEVKQKDTSVPSSPPPLPTRIPNLRPSLPFNNAISTYEKYTVKDDDDDDGIYDEIKDLRNGTRYQNIILSKKQPADTSDTMKHEAYHIRVPNERNEGQVQEEKSCDTIPYDDIVTLSRINTEKQQNRSIANGEERQEEFYDDVENLIPNGRFVKNRAKDQIEMSSKFVQKKSFLDRVLSRKESPSKSRTKRNKDKASPTPPLSAAAQEMPTYDEVSDLTSNQESLANEEKESTCPEYNCPPPPRPICAKSPVANSPSETEEFYDDVNACREQYNKNYQQIILQSTQESYTKAKEANNVTNNTELEANNDSSREELEHYQSPRNDLVTIQNSAAANIQQNEELYDDIALLADFTARQRDIIEKKDSEDVKPMIDFDKKTWNRFAVNRKSRANDYNYFTETNRRSNNECDEIEDSMENNNAAKRNTFQRLISRMENSLAKVSARSPPSIPMGKPSTSNNL